jgi:ribosomal protein S18 acetylase RimI-like enzyme
LRISQSHVAPRVRGEDIVTVTFTNLKIRPLRETDSLEDLTELLHRAYKKLADVGLQYLATHQTAEITRTRISKGTCYVAELDGQTVGTIIYRNPSQTKGTPHYDRPDIAYIGQMAVEPAFQGRGIATKLMRHVEGLARVDGASELAFDTSERATHLIDWYRRMGYEIVGHVKWDVTNYCSVIMSKRV